MGIASAVLREGLEPGYGLGSGRGDVRGGRGAAARADCSLLVRE